MALRIIRDTVALHTWKLCGGLDHRRFIAGALSRFATCAPENSRQIQNCRLPFMILNRAKILLGREGERIAERFLKKKGYKLVERNYRCAAGELDLIVLDRHVIVFVEVK